MQCRVQILVLQCAISVPSSNQCFHPYQFLLCNDGTCCLQRVCSNSLISTGAYYAPGAGKGFECPNTHVPKANSADHHSTANAVGGAELLLLLLFGLLLVSRVGLNAYKIGRSGV